MTGTIEISDNISFAMSAVIFVAITLPTMLILILKIRKKASLKPMFAGILSYVLFVLLVRSFINSAILEYTGSFGKLFQDDPLFYVILSGVTMILAMELGHYFTFRYAIHNYNDKHDALMYALGFGGAAGILSLCMNMVYYISVIQGIGYYETIDEFIASYGEEYKSAAVSLVEELSSMTVFDCVMKGLEGLTYMLLVLGGAMAVFYAVHKEIKKYLWLFMGVHLLFFVPSLIEALGGIDTSTNDIITFVMSISMILLAVKLHKSLDDAEDPFFHWPVKYYSGK